MLLIPARVEGILVNREKKISQKKTRVLKKEKIVYKNCIYTKKRRPLRYLVGIGSVYATNGRKKREWKAINRRKEIMLEENTTKECTKSKREKVRC